MVGSGPQRRGMHACRFNECYCKPFDDQSTYQIRARNDPCDETGHGILVVEP